MTINITRRNALKSLAVIGASFALPSTAATLDMEPIRQPIAPSPKPDLFVTGIPGLNELLGGGLRRGSMTLVYGPAGSGKTTFVRRMLTQREERGRSPLGKYAIYICPCLIREEEYIPSHAGFDYYLLLGKEMEWKTIKALDEWDNALAHGGVVQNRYYHSFLFAKTLREVALAHDGACIIVAQTRDCILPRDQDSYQVANEMSLARISDNILRVENMRDLRLREPGTYHRISLLKSREGPYTNGALCFNVQSGEQIWLEKGLFIENGVFVGRLRNS